MKSNNETQYYQQDRIYSADSIAISVTTCCLPYYYISNMEDKKITCEHIMNLNYYNHEESNRVYSVGGQTLQSQRKEKMTQEKLKSKNIPSTSNLRIRKLTPKECYRLMGFSDVDYERAK